MCQQMLSDSFYLRDTQLELCQPHIVTWSGGENIGQQQKCLLETHYLSGEGAVFGHLLENDYTVSCMVAKTSHSMKMRHHYSLWASTNPQ